MIIQKYEQKSLLNEGVCVNSRDLLQIGDHVHISPFCVVNAGSLGYTKKL